MPMGRSVYPIADTKILSIVGSWKDSVQVSMLSAITKNRTHTMDMKNKRVIRLLKIVFESKKVIINTISNIVA